MPNPSPGENEVVVENAAIGQDPVDWLLQEGFVLETFPLRPGEDSARGIHAVGKGFIGLHVFGASTGPITTSGGMGAFQEGSHDRRGWNANQKAAQGSFLFWSARGVTERAIGPDQ